MKFSAACHLALLGLISSQVQACNLSITFNGSCSYESIKQSSGCTDTQLKNKLGGTYKAVIETKCTEARNARYEKFLPWKKVASRGEQFDDEFFDGGTIFNTEDGEAVTGFKVKDHPDTQRIVEIKDNLVSSHGIQWPTSKNFATYSSCASNAVMCCWTSNRNTNAYVDNSDICSHEIVNSAGSAHVESGTTVLGDAGPSRCHGFVFEDGDPFKGNLLFKVAMEEGLLNGYVRNVPSAPMCACLEQMPVVTTAACSSSSATESWEATYGGMESFYITPGDVSISFGNCGGKDLAAYINEQIEEPEFKPEERLVGSCDKSVKESLEDLAFRKREENEFVSWVPVGGKGLLYEKSPNDEEFREIWKQSNNQIMRRRCTECENTHKDIYYRRFDANGLPESLDLLHVMKNYWYTDPEVPENTFMEDFKLYSTYEDAVNDVRPWKYCNFNDKTGFPRDCGPYGWVGNQWSTFQPYDGRHEGKRLVSFYVESGGLIIPE